MKARNVLVTGGNGFIGSHMVKRLAEIGYNVIVPFIEIDKSSFFHRNNLHKKTIFLLCDLRNADKTYNLIKKQKIDFIFHLAAQSIVEEALENPAITFETNIMGTVNVLEAARKLGNVSGILVSSSDKAYGKAVLVKETDPLGGDHPYETSKASADLIARTYVKTFGLPVIVTRFGNVYGEGDLNFSRIVPDTMRSIITKKPLIIRSNGKFVRDYVYVEDVVDACLKLARNMKRLPKEAFNISSYENLSVIELVNSIGKILNVEIAYKIINTALNEIPKQSVVFSKIRKKLGWKPKYRLASIIPKVFIWYKKYFEGSL